MDATYPEYLGHSTHSRPEQSEQIVRYGPNMTHHHTTSSVETDQEEHQGDSGTFGSGSFHDRLNEAAGEVSYRKLGRLTDTHPETVRRYMQGQAPSATFLTNMCHMMGISGEWLLTGRGPMKCADMRTHALSQADPAELLTAVANTLTDLCDRMDRIERFVQGLEIRLNVLSVSVEEPTDEEELDSESDSEVDAEPVSEPELRSKADKFIREGEPNGDADSVSMDDGSSTSDKRRASGKPGETSAKRIGDAISKRSS